MANKYERIFEQYMVLPGELTSKSQRWFIQQTLMLRKKELVTGLRFIKSGYGTPSARPRVGMLYTFRYYPKGQDTLPIWDMYPMVFIAKMYDDGFLGLNMHYLPFRQRAWVFDELLKYQVGNDDSARLRLKWETISKLLHRYAATEVIHRYLYKQISSPLRRLQEIDWPLAMILPTHQFFGEDETQLATKLKRGAIKVQ